MSKQYWEMRYKQKFDSGQGSKGEQGNWRRGVLRQQCQLDTDFILDYGCGDLSLWRYDNSVKFPFFYIGVDYSEIALSVNRLAHPSKLWFNPKDYLAYNIKPDVAICFDVLIHQMNINDAIELIRNLCIKTKRLVIIQNWRHSPFKGADTDGDYQIYRNITEYFKYFKEYGFEFSEWYNYDDGLNALYIFDRVNDLAEIH